jgi:hypothetical protein
VFTIVSFIKDIVDSLEFTETALNITFTATETQFDTCKTHHVTIGNYILINGVKYKVKDFEINSWIAVSGVVPNPFDRYRILPPNFFNGTPMQVQNVLANIRDWRNKLPMVYLLEIIREQRFNSRTNKLDRISDLRIFFLMSSNFQDWDISQHYDLAIEPMDNFVNDFILALRNNGRVGEFDDYETINRANFGVYISKPEKRSGKYEDNITKLIDENVSGVELKIDLPIQKDPCFSFNDCPSPSPVDPTPPFENLKSLDLDGSNDYVESANTSLLNASNVATWSQWLTTENILGGFIFGEWLNVAGETKVFAQYDGVATNLTFYLNGALVFQNTSVNLNVGTGQFYNIVCVFNGLAPSTLERYKVYIDSVEITNQFLPPTFNKLNTTTGAFRYGSIEGFPINFFEGKFTQMSIWKTAFNQSNVNELWNSGCPNDLNNHSQSANLIRWNKIDDAVFPNVPDFINGDDGTMNNMDAGDIILESPC